MPVAVVPVPAPICEAISVPETAVSAPVRPNVSAFTFQMSMPERRAASMLPPTA
ncbi:hypothetical protein D3C87_2151050 [compost metagenome]